MYQNFTNKQALLTGVLACLSQIERLHTGLNRLSDSSELPYTTYEAQQLADAIKCVEQLLDTADSMIGLQLQRWGL